MYLAKIALTTAYQYIPTLLDTYFAAKNMSKPYIANAINMKFTNFFSNTSPIIFTRDPPALQTGTEGQKRLLPEESEDFETSSGWYAKAVVNGEFLIIDQDF